MRNMFMRSIACMPVPNTIFRTNISPNVKIVRGTSTETDEKQCKEPCPDHSLTCTEKLKKIQSRFQENSCPIWLKSTKDRFIYMTTVGLALAGVGLSLFNIVIKI